MFFAPLPLRSAADRPALRGDAGRLRIAGVVPGTSDSSSVPRGCWLALPLLLWTFLGRWVVLMFCQAGWDYAVAGDGWSARWSDARPHTRCRYERYQLVLRPAAPVPTLSVDYLGLTGLGRSTRSGNGLYSLERHARDLAAVLDATVDDTTVLVGHSLGGMIVLMFCRLCPERLGRQVSGSSDRGRG